VIAREEVDEIGTWAQRLFVFIFTIPGERADSLTLFFLNQYPNQSAISAKDFYLGIRGITPLSKRNSG